MKKFATVFMLVIGCLSSFVAAAATKVKPEPTLAVHYLQDKSAGHRDDECAFGGIWSTPGDASREILTDELVKLGGLNLVEREELGTLYEQEFQQENLDQGSVAKRNGFQAAHFVVAGAVTEFEWCVSSGEQGIDLGGLLGVGKLALAHKTNKAHVALDLRLIEVRSGKILKTFTSEGEVDEGGLSMGADAFGIRIRKDTFERTPLGKATRIALSDAAAKIRDAVLKEAPPK